jgi:hypothetical protein
MAQTDVPATPDRAASQGDQELAALAADAYVYAYSLISVEISRRVITNVERPEGLRTRGSVTNDSAIPTPTIGVISDGLRNARRHRLNTHDIGAYVWIAVGLR